MTSVLTTTTDIVADLDVLRLLVIAETNATLPALAELIRSQRAKIEVASTCAEAVERGLIAAADAVVVLSPSSTSGQARLEAEIRRLAESLAAHRLGALVVIDRLPLRGSDRYGQVMTVPRSIGAEELWGRLQTIAHYRPLLAEMEHQLDNMQRLGKRLNRDFTELDQEMRLASRLQRDFLPRELPAVGRARFATLFRPASWVSGDIFDVARIDEHHIAFYVADAVGHGVAAGLLTMFIKQAVQSKRIEGKSYEILRPGATMARLNDVLADQHLPNSQFVTACYCLLNTETMEIGFARGGHPYPLHIHADGSIQEVKVEGGLLGLFENEEYPQATIHLRPGDKLLLFSDGLETTLIRGRDTHSGVPDFCQVLRDAARGSAQSLADAIGRALDTEEGSLNPHDDATVVVVEHVGS